MQENGTVFADTPRVDYSAGFLAAYKGLQLEDIKAKSGPVQYIVDEGVELGDFRSFTSMARSSIAASVCADHTDTVSMVRADVAVGVQCLGWTRP